MTRRSLLVSVLLGLLGASRLFAEIFGAPLTPEQVACEERQLARLVGRMGSNLLGSRCAGRGQLACHELYAPSLGLYVLPPLRPGIESQGPGAFARGAHLNIDREGSELNVLHATVNWADLLRDTSWNGGLQP